LKTGGPPFGRIRGGIRPPRKRGGGMEGASGRGPAPGGPGGHKAAVEPGGFGNPKPEGGEVGYPSGCGGSLSGKKPMGAWPLIFPLGEIRTKGGAEKKKQRRPPNHPPPKGHFKENASFSKGAICQMGGDFFEAPPISIRARSLLTRGVSLSRQKTKKKKNTHTPPLGYKGGGDQGRGAQRGAGAVRGGGAGAPRTGILGRDSGNKTWGSRGPPLFDLWGGGGGGGGGQGPAQRGAKKALGTKLGQPRGGPKIPEGILVTCRRSGQILQQGARKQRTKEAAGREIDVRTPPTGGGRRRNPQQFCRCWGAGERGGAVLPPKKTNCPHRFAGGGALDHLLRNGGEGGGLPGGGNWGLGGPVGEFSRSGGWVRGQLRTFFRGGGVVDPVSVGRGGGGGGARGAGGHTTWQIPRGGAGGGPTGDMALPAGPPRKRKGGGLHGGGFVWGGGFLGAPGRGINARPLGGTPGRFWRVFHGASGGNRGGAVYNKFSVWPNKKKEGGGGPWARAGPPQVLGGFFSRGAEDPKGPRGASGFHGGAGAHFSEGLGDRGGGEFTREIILGALSQGRRHGGGAGCRGIGGGGRYLWGKGPKRRKKGGIPAIFPRDWGGQRVGGGKPPRRLPKAAKPQKRPRGRQPLPKLKYGGPGRGGGLAG